MAKSPLSGVNKANSRLDRQIAAEKKKAEKRKELEKAKDEREKKKKELAKLKAKK